MSNCSTSVIYGNIKHCPGEARMPGIKSNVLFIQKSKIKTWPTAEHQSGIYDEDETFVLHPGAEWTSIQGIKSLGSADIEAVGTKPFKTFDVSLKVFVPGLHAEVLAFANQATNDDLVFAYQDASGDVKIIGHEFGEVEVNPTGATGTGSGDSYGETCIISCNMPYQPLVLSCILALDEIPANALTDVEGYILTDAEGYILTDNTVENENKET